MQKHVNLVDLVKSFPTTIFLQNLASVQKRTSPIKFAHLAEKSEKGSISNLSTKGSAGTAGSSGAPTPGVTSTSKSGFGVAHRGNGTHAVWRAKSRSHSRFGSGSAGVLSDLFRWTPGVGCE